MCLDQLAADREASPRPPAFVVTKGWNSRSATSGAIPGPVSATAISTASGNACVVTIKVLGGARLHRLSTALRTRLMIHLADLDPIEHQRPGRRVQFHRPAHALMRRADQSEFDRLPDHTVDVLTPARGAALGDMVAQPPDHFAGACGLLADPLDDFAHSVRIGIRAPQHPTEGARA